MSADNDASKEVTLESYFYGPLPSVDTTLTIFPYLMGDFHYDTYDVRSSTKHSADACLAVPLSNNTGYEIACTPEKILTVDRSLLHPLPKQGLTSNHQVLPYHQEIFDLLHEAFLAFILQHYKIQIYHNPDLGFYSRYAESQQQFINRCRYRVDQILGEERNKLKQKYNLRMEQIKKKYIGKYSAVAYEETSLDIIQSGKKRSYSETKNKLINIFVSGVVPNEEIEAIQRLKTDGRTDLDEVLAELLIQAKKEIRTIEHHLRRSTDLVEAYSIPLRRGDLVLDQVSIMWKSE